ncbi:hypothetical protein AGLY_011870 [Aphis glycines]|uniref:Uncharacterized protein n=1 Tax=Aphis glycines TaxID=307491 RepID=A0A6G0TDK9_APHGL|nr:hypothetical protein AGLY_011870 [Aphis glycines]
MVMYRVRSYLCPLCPNILLSCNLFLVSRIVINLCLMHLIVNIRHSCILPVAAGSVNLLDNNEAGHKISKTALSTLVFNTFSAPNTARFSCETIIVLRYLSGAPSHCLVIVFIINDVNKVGTLCTKSFRTSSTSSKCPEKSLLIILILFRYSLVSNPVSALWCSTQSKFRIDNYNH